MAWRLLPQVTALLRAKVQTLVAVLLDGAAAGSRMTVRVVILVSPASSVTT